MEKEKAKYFLIVINTCFVAFMAKLDSFIVNVSLPTIARSFEVNTAKASQIVLAYLLMLTSTMLIFGKLEDRLGIKKVFLSGYFLFSLGSLFCGISPSINLLILSRSLQGIGGAMLLTSGYTAITKLLPEKIKGWGLSIMATAVALGIAVGAPLGGFITGFFSWRWIFFINVPIGIIGIFVSQKVLPKDTPSPRKLKIPFDILGMVLSFFGFFTFVYALSMSREKGWNSPFILGIFACSLILTTLFFLREKRIKFPILELKLFQNKSFVLGNAAAFLNFLVIAGSSFIMPFYLQLGLGLKVQQVGLVILLYSIAYVLGAPMAGVLSDNPRLRLLCPFAALLGSFSCFMFAFNLSTGGLAAAIFFLILLGAASAFFITPNNRLIMINIPKGKEGAGSGIYNTISNMSMTFGVSFFSIIFSYVVHQGDTSTANTLSILPGPLFSAIKVIYIFAGTLMIAVFTFSIFSVKKQ